MHSTHKTAIPNEKLNTLVELRIRLVDIAEMLKNQHLEAGGMYAKARIEDYLNVTQKHIDELGKDIGPIESGKLNLEIFLIRLKLMAMIVLT